MRHKKRTVGKGPLSALLLTALVVVITLLGSGTALAADHWTDISDSKWMTDYGVTAAQAATVAAGYDDGTFKPALAVTRGQFAKMVVSGFDLGTSTPLAATFSDVLPTNYYFPWVEGAYDAAIIGGYGDGTFRPGTSISRQQSNSILGLFLSQKELSLRGHVAGDEDNYASLSAWYLAEGTEILAEFADASSVSSVHAPSTAYLAFHGVVQGSSRGGGVYLDPGSNLTRAQAVALILRVKAVTFSTALPTITLVNPSSGPTAGGNSVIITGTDLTGATVVKFGTVNAISYVVNSATQITVVAPAGTAGTAVDVQVTTPAGTSAIVAADKYSYGIPTITLLTPGAGTAAGGTSVVITGTNLTGATVVKFGTVDATSYIVNSTTQITAVAPAGTSGSTVDVTVTTPAGTSADTLADNYSYGAPTITAVSPGAGAAAGGTTVTITGTGFSGVNAATGVAFGGGTHYATGVVLSENGHTITCVSPSGTSGSTVDVTVTTPAGTSGIVAADRYTYGTLHFAVTGIADPATAGTATTVTVTVKDLANTTMTGYRGTIHFTSNDPFPAILPGDYTFTAGDNGVHTFTNGVTLKTAGSRTVTATDTLVSSITGSQTVVVNPGAATKLAFGVQPSNTVAGASITPAITVRIEDANGNLVTGDSTTGVTLAIANNAGPGGVLSGTAVQTAVGGVATFSGLSINLTGTGYTLGATSSPVLTPATSSAFNIT